MPPPKPGQGKPAVLHKSPEPAHLHKPPALPHEKGPHEKGLPAHERARKARPKRIAISLIAGTAVAFVVGLVLHFFQISINVILPVLAPIWVGVVTLAFTAMSQH